MNPTATVELLSRYLDGDLAGGERARVEALIEEDDEARRLLDGLTRVRSGLADLPETDLPPHLGALVRQRVAVEVEERTVWRRLDRQLRRWLLDPSFLPAFAVLVALAAMLYVLAQGLARVERATGPVILSAPAGSAPADERVELAGRTLRRDGERWVESGVAASEAVRTVSGGALRSRLEARPEEGALASLGVVVVDDDGEVVVLDFTSMSD